jgi:hypothetical protein
MPFWKVLYRLAVMICIEKDKAGMCRELAKLVTKQVFSQKKQSVISKHTNKLVLFIADSI